MNKIYINESKLDAAFMAKRLTSQILSFLKALAKKNMLDKYSGVNFKLTGQRIAKSKNEIDYGAKMTLKIDPEKQPFKQVLKKGMPYFWLIFDDTYKNKGGLELTAQGIFETYTLKVGMGGAVSKLVDGDISQQEFYKEIEKRKDTLYHELAHFYDEIYETGISSSTEDHKNIHDYFFFKRRRLCF